MIKKFNEYKEENLWDFPRDVSSPEEAFRRRDHWLKVEREREREEEEKEKKMLRKKIDPYDEEKWNESIS